MGHPGAPPFSDSSPLTPLLRKGGGLRMYWNRSAHEICRDSVVTLSIGMQPFCLHDQTCLKSLPNILLPFQGAKTFKAISSWAAKQLPQQLITVSSTEDELDAFLTQPDPIPRVLLFSEKADTSALYKALSLRLVYRMVCAGAGRGLISWVCTRVLGCVQQRKCAAASVRTSCTLPRRM